MDVSEQAAERFLIGHGLRPKRFSKIDLYVWWNEWMPREPKPHFNNVSPFYLTLCGLLKSDPRSHRVL